MERSIARLLVPASLAILAACGGGGGGGGGPQATGTLNLRIGDAPVDNALEVIVVFTGVELKPLGGAPFRVDFCNPTGNLADCRRIDLLQLQDGVTDDLLRNQSVAAGQYEWLRLAVVAERNRNDASYIRLDNGNQYPLYVPSGAETGLKLVRPFTVAQGGITRLVVDFDLRKSVIAPPGLAPNYLLKPTLRLVDELQTGTLEGQVDLAALGTELQKESCTAGVYLFTGSDATPDDMDGATADGPDPLVYAALTADAAGGTVASYTFPFIEAGSYTVAFTCDFAVDAAADASEYDPAATEGQPGYQSMSWVTANATVNAGETVVVDFPFTGL
ncbi:MAG: DUF4382 domain-containing protein [Gammaproteobacteria bacterium]|nr:DUF4382 domain-containing protein [Gammaproteobacteria bacterium]